MRLLLFPIFLAVSCCSSPLPPISHVTGEYGRHQLPFRPNERFVLVSITAEPLHLPDRFIEISYILDGHRRKFVLSGAGTTDGYVTDLGRMISSESSETESPIMEERVILLASGEQITVVGNTVSEGEVRLRNRKEG
jgi:hypothetical protein